MITLGIESTCDETGAAIVKGGKIILSNVLATSADIHEKYGGVFPELACRRHIDAIIPVIDEALKKGGIAPEEIDLIAVARGPGLIGALLIGMNVAKGLSIAWKKPLIGVNHVEAHIYASMMELEEIPTPSLGVVLSGGHTFFVKILSQGIYEPISSTVDDAAGEAFDKVATLLGLPYPGGPQIEKLAQKGNPKAYRFSAGKVKKSPLDFSFSGLKTAVRYAIEGKRLKEAEKADVAASFQEVAFQDIVAKAKLASKSFSCQAIFFGGGVSNNLRLRELFRQEFLDIPLFWPPQGLSVDNAVMIAALGSQKFKGQSDPLDLEAMARIPLV